MCDQPGEVAIALLYAHAFLAFHMQPAVTYDGYL
jgi:hypothetical protein